MLAREPNTHNLEGHGLMHEKGFLDKPGDLQMSF